MLLINQSRQHDGYTFSLDPTSKRELLNLRPDVNPLPRVFIALNNFSDFQKERGDLYEQVVQLLTRLSPKELLDVGFEIVDPVTGQRVDA